MPGGAGDGSTVDVACPSLNGDGWTMVDDPGAELYGMTAPVCPYTVVLDTAPFEGTTVVVSLREEHSVSTFRDHELFFYEEPSYRNGVVAADCVPEKYPGSGWVSKTIASVSAGPWSRHTHLHKPVPVGQSRSFDAETASCLWRNPAGVAGRLANFRGWMARRSTAAASSTTSRWTGRRPRSPAARPTSTSCSPTRTGTSRAASRSSR